MQVRHQNFAVSRWIPRLRHILRRSGHDLRLDTCRGYLQVGWRILKVDGVPMPVDDSFYIKEQIIQRINAGADMRPVHICVLFERGAIVACALHATAIIRFLKDGRLLRLQGLTLTSSSPR